MIFDTLEAQNFLSIGPDFKVEFEDGLILVTGENMDAPKADSNGAGKSAILEAIVWCLWGKTIRDLKSDEVINERVGKNCFVRLQLVDGKKEYTIFRCRKLHGRDKANDLEVWIDGEEETLTSVGATQEIIDNIIGMDFHTFCAMMPGAGVKVADLTDKSIKLLLESILQTQEMSEAHAIALAKKKEAKRELDLEERTVQHLTKEVQDTEERIATYKKSSENFEESQKLKIEAIQLRKETKEMAKERLEEEALEYLAQLGEARALTVEKAFAKALYTSSLWQVEHVKEICMSMKSAQSASISRLQSIIQDCKSTMKELQLHKRYKHHSTCKTCGGVLSQRVVEEQLKSKSKSLGHYENTMASLRDEHKEHLLSHEINVNLARTRKVKHALKVQEAQHKIDNLKNVRVLKARNKKDRLSINSDIVELETEIQAIQAEANPFDDLWSQENLTLLEVNQRLTQSNERLQELIQQHERLSFWVQGFSPSGLRSFMLSTVVPLLNNRAKEYCTLLTNDELEVTFSTQTTQKSGKVAEKFAVEVDYAHGGSSWKGASMGEKARADLVIAMTLGDLAAMRSHKKISFRFMDEPFESIDDSGVEAIVQLLQSQVKEYNSVYVITHNDSFKQMFPKSLTVVKKDGFTRINE